MNDFAEFYRALHPRLVSSLAAWCGSTDLAAEAADEAAVRALERWDRVVEMGNPEGWVFRVGMNHLKRRMRRRSLEQSLLRRDRQPDDTVAGPAGEMWMLVADLSDRQRQAVVLRHLGQLTEPEIAEVMGVSRGTVSSTLRAAHTNLRTALDDSVLDHSVDEPIEEGVQR